CRRTGSKKKQLPAQCARSAGALRCRRYLWSALRARRLYGSLPRAVAEKRLRLEPLGGVFRRPRHRLVLPCQYARTTGVSGVSAQLWDSAATPAERRKPGTGYRPGVTGNRGRQPAPRRTAPAPAILKETLVTPLCGPENRALRQSVASPLSLSFVNLPAVFKDH